MARIEIREEVLPGVGTLWEMSAAEEHTVAVIVHSRSNRRELCIRTPGRDEPDCCVKLSDVQAVALAGLLTGAHVVVEPEAGPGEVSQRRQAERRRDA